MNSPDITRKTARDNIFNFIKAGFATMPWCGGIATLIDEYIPKSTEISLNKFLKYVGEKIKELKDKMDFKIIDKEEFTETFKSCYLGIIRTTREEKIKIFARIFANIFLKEGESEKIKYEELDHLIGTMDNLSIGSLKVMVTAYKYSKNNKNKGFNFETLFKRIDGIDVDLAFSLVNELNTANLLHIKTYPTVITANYGNFPIEITELGIRFVEKFAYDL